MEVTFNKAKYSTRLFAFLFDLVIIILVGLALVLASHQILIRQDFFKTAGNKMDEINELSGLYRKNEQGVLTKLSEYYSPKDEVDYKQANSYLDATLKSFYASEEFFPNHDGTEHYFKLALDTGYFIYTDESKTDIAAKEDADYKELYKFYCQTVAEDGPLFIMKYPGYVEATKVINACFIGLIIVAPITLTILIFEFIVPLIFRRGYRTFGKLLLKIAVVDSRGLAPKFWRFLLRFLIFLFLEILLSLVTFAIPLILSFTMAVFTKTNQAFHDYLVGTYVVDTTNTRIFYTEEEYKRRMKEASELEIKSENVVF